MLSAMHCTCSSSFHVQDNKYPSNRKWTHTKKKENNILSYTRAIALAARHSIVYIENRWVAFLSAFSALCKLFFSSLLCVLLVFFSLSCVCGCFIYTDFKLSSQISTERKKKKKKKRREKTTKRNWHKLWMKKKCRFQFSRYYKFFLLPHISRTDRYSVCIILVCQTKRNLLCAISLSYYNASIFAVIFSWLEFDRQIIGARPV